jgi:hypothetical protein
MTGSVCLVTVHGIGFQQPPKPGIPGYADALHEHLRGVPDLPLGEDPDPPGGGPVYVQSEFDGSPAKGLARLDRGRALCEEGKVAHVALVYSPSEPLEPRFGDTAEALARAAVSHAHYTSALGAVRLIMSDLWAALHEQPGGERRSTLVPRTDLQVPVHHGLFGRALHHGEQAAAPGPAPASSAPGPLSTLRALEDDVATYVTRNDLRERVRDFVEDALLALVDRGDIGALVINAHSQGTVLCWDVLCRLPFSSWRAGEDRPDRLFRYFVTAGSPIRKYVDMFAWGDHVGELAAVLEPGGLEWHNFCDPEDPVADPLNPPASWRPGQDWDPPPAGDGGLLVARDPDGHVRHVTVTDVRVDNIRHSSGGGLQAHDYWDNTEDFIPALAGLLREAESSRL